MLELVAVGANAGVGGGELVAVEELVLVGDLGGDDVLGVPSLLDVEASQGIDVLDLDAGGNGAVGEAAALLSLEGDAG